MAVCGVCFRDGENILEVWLEGSERGGVLENVVRDGMGANEFRGQGIYTQELGPRVCVCEPFVCGCRQAQEKSVHSSKGSLLQKGGFAYPFIKKKSNSYSPLLPKRRTGISLLSHENETCC